MRKDVADDPDLKFLEVHWWQPPGDKFHLGYRNNRLYQATRLNRRNQCVDHIDVISELSVLLCFEDLVSKKLKGSTLVNGKLGAKVITQASHLAKLTAKRSSEIVHGQRLPKRASGIGGDGAGAIVVDDQVLRCCLKCAYCCNNCFLFEQNKEEHGGVCTPPSKRRRGEVACSTSSSVSSDADFRMKLARLRQSIIPHLRLDYRTSTRSAWRRGTLTVLHEEENGEEEEEVSMGDAVVKYCLQLDDEEDSRFLCETDLEVGVGLFTLGAATPCK